MTTVKWTKADRRRAWAAVTGFQLTHGEVTMDGIEPVQFKEGVDEDHATMMAALHDLELTKCINEDRIVTYQEAIDHRAIMEWDPHPPFGEAIREAEKMVRIYARLVDKIKTHGMPPKL